MNENNKQRNWKIEGISQKTVIELGLTGVPILIILLMMGVGQIGVYVVENTIGQKILDLTPLLSLLIGLVSSVLTVSALIIMLQRNKKVIRENLDKILLHKKNIPARKTQDTIGFMVYFTFWFSILGIFILVSWSRSVNPSIETEYVLSKNIIELIVLPQLIVPPILLVLYYRRKESYVSIEENKLYVIYNGVLNAKIDIRGIQAINKINDNKIKIDYEKKIGSNTIYLESTEERLEQIVKKINKIRVLNNI